MTVRELTKEVGQWNPNFEVVLVSFTMDESEVKQFTLCIRTPDEKQHPIESKGFDYVINL